MYLRADLALWLGTQRFSQMCTGRMRGAAANRRGDPAVTALIHRNAGREAWRQHANAAT
jgi:hypothetical protein